MSGFEVVKAGIFTLIQDRGRFGFSHLGVSSSGFLDEYAAFWANKLLKNSLDTNLLEIAFSNVELKSNVNTTLAITGAICEFTINGVEKNLWSSHKVKAGDTIKIGKILKGSRVYLAVKNGFDIKKEFGSNSTSVKELLGGIDGQKLKNGDFLKVNSSEQLAEKRALSTLIPNFESDLKLRVILSYQDDSFSKEEQDKFFSNSYKVTSDFNRMACKLSGEPITSSLNGIISEGIGFGSIQVPKDGQPIILLKERQTIGGYPKIGSVLPIDCFKLAQAKIGSEISFERIAINEAQNKLRDFYSIFS